MKKIYKSLEIEMIIFDEKDVITTSGDDLNIGNPSGSNNDDVWSKFYE